MDLTLILNRSFSKSAVFALGLLAILVWGFVDYITGYEISVFVFYGIPIVAVAWFADRKMALLSALLAALVWWWADRLALHPYRWGWLQAWETLVRLTFFLFAAVSGSVIRAHNNSSKSRIKLLEHTAQLEQEIVNISEAEQVRIGQDLHDGICQCIAALGYSAASLDKDLVKLGRHELALKARDISGRLNETAAQTRALARGLVPVEMNAAGLISGLEELAASTTRFVGIECVFEGGTDTEVSNHLTATHLYRIGQEAVNNAVRHAKATQVKLHLRSSGTGLELRVEDNGTGMPPEPPDSKGMGLKIMQYRAGCMGGHLSFEWLPTGGTAVQCFVPDGAS